MQKTIVPTEDLQSIEGIRLVDSSKVILLMDGDSFIFKGEGQPTFCVVGISCAGDGGYDLQFDSPVNFYIGSDSEYFPAGKKVSIPSFVGFGLEFYAPNHRFYVNFNNVGDWHF